MISNVNTKGRDDVRVVQLQFIICSNFIDVPPPRVDKILVSQVRNLNCYVLSNRCRPLAIRWRKMRITKPQRQMATIIDDFRRTGDVVRSAGCKKRETKDSPSPGEYIMILCSDDDRYVIISYEIHNNFRSLPKRTRWHVVRAYHINSTVLCPSSASRVSHYPVDDDDDDDATRCLLLRRIRILYYIIMTKHTIYTTSRII